MTDLMIKAINKMGAEKGSKNNKVPGKENQIMLNPADWLTGLDSLEDLDNSYNNIDVGDNDDDSLTESNKEDHESDGDSNNEVNDGPNNDIPSLEDGNSDDEDKSDNEDQEGILYQEDVIKLLAGQVN